MSDTHFVPYVQDEAKWVQHYMKKGMKQLKESELTRTYKEPTLKPNLVLPTTQLAAQAKSEMKRGDKEAPIYAPIKATPATATPASSTSAVEGRTTRKRKAITTPTQGKKNKKKGSNPTKKRKTNLGVGRDIFHT